MAYLLDYLNPIENILTRSPFGLITDFDGTISETAPTPQQAGVSPLCRQSLSILSQHLALVAAISGRPAVEVKNLINIDQMVYVGNHGLEQWAEGRSEVASEARDYPEVMRAVIDELARPLSTMEGVWIEDKGVTATIHYRLSPDPQAAERHVRTVLESLPLARRLQMIPGKMSINLIPPVAINKGTATLDLIRWYNLKGGLYLGDDITDLDAFRAIHSTSPDADFQGFAISVTGEETPAELVAESDFTLNGVGDVELFLKWMAQTVPQLG